MISATESSLPDIITLQNELRAEFRASGAASDTFAIVGREPNEYGSTYPSEILSLSFDGQPPIRLLCKYEAGRRESEDGHRRGIGYELAVYRTLLGPLGVTVPRLYAGYADEVDYQSWMAIQWVEPGLRINRQHIRPPGVVRAAAWIGDFHRRTEKLASEPMSRFLMALDAQYLLRWPDLLLKQAAAVIGELPWLQELISRFQADVGLLLSNPVVVHGEYYPDNILCADGVIYPVDWQSTAIGAGETDLAVLTHGSWNSETVQECAHAYQTARWPEGASAQFETRFALAKVAWLCRVLAEAPPGRIRRSTFLDEFRSAGRTLGVV